MVKSSFEGNVCWGKELDATSELNGELDEGLLGLVLVTVVVVVVGRWVVVVVVVVVVLVVVVVVLLEVVVTGTFVVRVGYPLVGVW